MSFHIAIISIQNISHCPMALLSVDINEAAVQWLCLLDLARFSDQDYLCLSRPEILERELSMHKTIRKLYFVINIIKHALHK